MNQKEAEGFQAASPGASEATSGVEGGSPTTNLKGSQPPKYIRARLAPLQGALLLATVPGVSARASLQPRANRYEAFSFERPDQKDGYNEEFKPRTTFVEQEASGSDRSR